MPQSTALWFMFFAYSAVFLILFAFVSRTLREASQMRKEIERLKAEVGESEARKAE
jgi:CcmD family protein